jgi:hypothetical protein
MLIKYTKNSYIFNVRQKIIKKNKRKVLEILKLEKNLNFQGIIFNRDTS